MQGPVSLFHNFEKHFLSNDTLIKIDNCFYIFEKASNHAITACRNGILLPKLEKTTFAI